MLDSGTVDGNCEEASTCSSVGGAKQLKDVGSVADLSKHMQALWAFAEQASAAQTKTRIGRYDIDGCYDINLLSYT